jgi:hypothetical protein
MELPVVGGAPAPLDPPLDRSASDRRADTALWMLKSSSFQSRFIQHYFFIRSIGILVVVVSSCNRRSLLFNNNH